ncbi:MAG TPA: AAA family ATPase [Pyrinomonadaceae bacterium]
MKRNVSVVAEESTGQPFARLEAFRRRHQLSVRDLAKIAGGPGQGASSSQMLRLLHGQTTQETFDELTPKLRDGLRHYLTEKGNDPAFIERELDGVFSDDTRPFSLTARQQLEFQTWSQRLEAFRLHYALSYNKLEKMCGGPDNGVCASSLHRRGGDFSKEPRSGRRIKPLVIAGLRCFLASRGRTPEEIQDELSNIFPLEEVAVITPRTKLDSEAQKFFGLRRDPFDPTEPRLLKHAFTWPALDKLAAQIEDAINYQGFLGISGEIGSGKTIMKSRVMGMVERSGGRLNLFWPEFYNMDRVHSGSIVSYILRAFNQSVPLDVVARADKLKHILASASEEGVRVALAFDECHHLHDKLVTALKNFWETGTGGYTRFLGIVLFGQPKFEDKLRDAKFREIVERIEVVKMPELKKAAPDYLSHRLRLAGSDLNKLFDPDAVRLLTKQATTPLALGNLANAALLKAYSLNERKVLASFIRNEDGEPAVRAVRRAS